MGFKSTQAALRVEIEDLAEQTETSSSIPPAQLILSHRELGIKIAWRLLSNWRIRLPQDDVLSMVGIALCEAASRFDPTKGATFGTFLFYHVRGVLLKEIANAMNERRFRNIEGDQESYYLLFNTMCYVNGDSALVETNTPERNLQKQELGNILNSAYSALDDLEKTVLTRHFINEESLVDIAKDLDYCRCHISRVKTTAVSKIGKHFDSIETKDETAITGPKEVPSAHAVAPKAKYTGGRGRRRLKQGEEEAIPVKRVA